MNKNNNFEERIGEINYNNQGLKMYIKEYRKANDIDIEFEDGFVAYNKRYTTFKSGEILNKHFKKTSPSKTKTIKTNRVGETNINTQGLKMWIREYRKFNDIDVEFEDGFISCNKQYHVFKNGNILNKNFKKVQPIKNRINEIGYNKHCSKMTISIYTNAEDIIVEFENGYRTHTNYNAFKNGEVYSPYDKTIFNIGWIGEGKYYTRIYGKTTLMYTRWKGMLMRCYSDKFQNRNPQYIGCTVCKKWLCFQNFAEWFYENYYEIEEETIDLDKDILIKGNKIYSPDTCCFTPERINDMFVMNNKSRGDLPIGVEKLKVTNGYRYRASYKKIENTIRKKITIGYFDTPIQAFNAYKQEKEKYIKQVADEYKDRIPQKLFNAMYNYQVEIDD